MPTSKQALLTSLFLVTYLLFVSSSTLRVNSPRPEHPVAQYVKDNQNIAIKRTSSFRIPPEARSRSPQFEERALDPAVYNAAIQKGTALLCQFKNGGQPSKFKDYSDLATYGWNAAPSDPENNIPKPELKGVLEDLSLSTDSSQNIYVSMEQNGDWPVLGNDGKPVPGKTEGAVGGQYQEIYNPRQGVILAENNYSPSYMVGGDRATQVLPDLQRWSDVVYLVWANLCSKNNGDVKGIKYLIRSHIKEKETNTKDIIDQVLGEAAILPYDGKTKGTTFSMDTDEGKALLGSAHGYGTAWFLINHQETLGNKEVDSITVFQTTSDGGNVYNMLFKIKDV